MIDDKTLMIGTQIEMYHACLIYKSLQIFLQCNLNYSPNEFLRAISW